MAGRRARSRLIIATATAAAVIIAGAVWAVTRDNPTVVTSKRPAQVTFGSLTVDAPAGASGDRRARLSVEERPPVDDPETPELRTVAAFEINLSSGQPEKPIRLTWRLPEPLPANRAIGFTNGTPGEDDVTTLIPAVSADRMTVSAITDHLSPVDVIEFDAAAFWARKVGQLTGDRADPPSCSGSEPHWIDQVIYTDGEDDNDPLLVCHEVVFGQPDLVRMKIANNRGTALNLKLPVAPRRIELDDVPGITAAAGSGLAALVAPDGQLSLAGTQTASVVFHRDDLAAFQPATIQGAVNGVDLAFGLVIDLIQNEALGPLVGSNSKVARTAAYLLTRAALARCTIDASLNIADVANAAYELTMCVTNNYPTLLNELRTLIGPEAFAKLSPNLIGAKLRTPKLVKRGVFILELSRAAWVAGEVASSLNFEKGALAVSIFTFKRGNANENLLGTWSGQVDQEDAAPYSVRLQLRTEGDRVVGTVIYPELGCGGTVKSRRNDRTLVMTEFLTVGADEGRCVETGALSLKQTDDGMSYRWESSGLEATADLIRSAEVGELAGDWRGPVDQEGEAYTTELSLAGERTVKGTVRYPELDNCSGSTREVLRAGSVVLIQETITEGVGRCVEEVLLVLELQGTDLSVGYFWGSGGKASAILIR